MERQPPTLETLDQHDRAIARAIADLAIGLSTATTQSLARHDELMGLLLALVTERREERKRDERKRRDSSEDTSRFKIPGGETGDAIELTRKTQRKILEKVLLVLLFLISHVANYLLSHQQPTNVDQHHASQRALDDRERDH